MRSAKAFQAVSSSDPSSLAPSRRKRVLACVHESQYECSRTVIMRVEHMALPRLKDRLAYLIEDILTLSTLESGSTGLDLREVKLHQIAESVLDGLREMADKKKVQLKNSVPEALTLQADSQRLFQALNNLVENGIKYGGECVYVSASHMDGKLDLCVSDDGPGIPAEACDRIFERFFRIDKARSREMGGTGLGLSIVKHIIQLHGGTARVESELGKGASFHLTFPAMGVEATHLS